MWAFRTDKVLSVFLAVTLLFGGVSFAIPPNIAYAQVATINVTAPIEGQVFPTNEPIVSFSVNSPASPVTRILATVDGFAIVDDSFPGGGAFGNINYGIQLNPTFANGLPPLDDGQHSFKVEVFNGALIAEQTVNFSIDTAPQDLYVVSDGQIIVNGVVVYDGTTGAAKDLLVDHGSGGLDIPWELAFGPDGNLYVTSSSTNEVLRFNGNTGAFLDVFVAAGAGGLSNPIGMVFGPDGNLYVVSSGTNQVLRFNGNSGAFLDVFVAAGAGGLSGPFLITFGPDGNLYIPSSGTSQILRFDGATGAFLDIFVDAGVGGLAIPLSVTFGPDGNLYVVSRPGILRYNGSTGAFIGVFVAAGAGAGLDNPLDAVFGPDGNLYVTNKAGFNITRYNGITGAFIDEFVTKDNGGLNNPNGLIFGPASPLPINTPPVANAGADQIVDDGLLVSLDSSATTDAQGNPLTFSWTQTAGPQVTLSDPTATNPSFFAPLVGVDTVLTFSLVVKDKLVQSTPDTVDITVRQGQPIVSQHSLINISNDFFISGPSSVDASGDNVYIAWTEAKSGPDSVIFRKSIDRGVSYGPPITLSDGVTNAERPQIDSSGNNVYVLFTDTSSFNGDLFLRASNDGGTTFLPTINLSNNPGSSTGADIFASGNNVYVAWHDDSSGTFEILLRASTDGGNTFGPIINLSNNGNRSFIPLITASENSVHVAWLDDTPPSTLTSLLIRSSSNNGISFGPTTTLNTTPGSDIDIFDIDSQGQSIYLLFNEGGNNIFRSSNDNGLTFNPPVIVSAAIGTLKISASGINIHAMWKTDDIFISSSNDAGLSFNAPINLSVNEDLTNVLDLESSGNSVYAFWSDRTSGFFKSSFSVSQDGGASFLNRSVLPGLTVPKMAVSGNDVYVIATDTTVGQGDVFFTKSRDNGITFNIFQNISNTPSFSSTSAIAAVGSNFYVVWQDSGIVGSGNTQTFFKKSVDNGLTFDDITNLSIGAFIARNPDIEAVGADVHTVWEETTAPDLDIFYRVSNDNGQNFSPKIQLSDNNGKSELPHVKVLAGNVYVVWVDDTPGNQDIFFIASNDNGVNFNPIINLSNDGTKSVAPVIAIFGNIVFVVWQDGESNPSEILMRISIDNGVTFGPTINLSQTNEFSSQPDVAAANGNVYVTWREGSASLDIFARVSNDNGLNFGNAVNLSNDPSVSSSPSVEAEGLNAYFIWNDSSNPDIFYRRTIDSGASFETTVNLSSGIDNSGNGLLETLGNNVYVAWAANHQSQPTVFLRASTDNGNTFGDKLSLGGTNLGSIEAAGNNVYLLGTGQAVSTDVFYARSIDNGANFFIGDNPPVANSGADQTVNEGVIVNLDGQLSSDSEGKPITFSWAQIAGPPAVLSNPTSSIPSFTAPNVVANTILKFQLIVNDVFLNSIPDVVEITVNNIPVDTDADGILDDVDTVPGTSSNDFSDVNFGGTTSGTITDRADLTFEVSPEAGLAGIRIKAFGGTQTATVSACNGNTLASLNNGDDITILCTSSSVSVNSGTVEFTFTGDDGTNATTTLSQNFGLIFDPTTFTFTAPATNPGDVFVAVNLQEFTIAPNSQVIIDTTITTPAQPQFLTAEGIPPIFPTTGFGATLAHGDVNVVGSKINPKF